MEKPNQPTQAKPCKSACPTFHSNELFAGGKVVVILHGGREYQLRITNANKLILTA
ncbi:MAG: hemin uptake protein HemP [Hydrogenophilaceae bacterium]|nr:hemin uptake protein HemP [Hydrogenophilaceae bacterium]